MREGKGEDVTDRTGGAAATTQTDGYGKRRGRRGAQAGNGKNQANKKRANISANGVRHAAHSRIRESRKRVRDGYVGGNGTTTADNARKQTA